MTSHRTIETALVLRELPDSVVSRIRENVRTVHYYPDKDVAIPASVLASVDVAFVSWNGFPPSVPSVREAKKLALVQLFSAGAERALASPALKEAVEDGKGAGGPRFAITTASGIGVRSLASWLVTQVFALNFRLPQLILFARNERRWAGREDLREPDGSAYVARDLYGKTVGILGYGHIGREAARLFSAFGATIIAANTTGKAKEDGGYILPGTGDKEGIIPEAYYSTRDRSSLASFLKRSQVLVASLPSTPETRGLLNEENLALLPKGSLFLNVGRGDLVSSDALLKALDGNLAGAALDVTSPEPLPTDHPLFSHPRVIVTPHIAGETEEEGAKVADVFLENIRRLRAGEGLVNVVDVDKGY